MAFKITTLNRYNRVRAITIETNLADGLALGDAIAYMEGLVEANLPEIAIINYKGQSQDYKYSTRSILFVFLLGILVVFLVLAAQFESYLNPLVIMLTVPLAIAGGLMGLYLTGSTLNLYSKIGLVMLIGLAAKNGILIVEFANQLRDRRKSFHYAVLKASEVRLRPIVMTGNHHGHRCDPPDSLIRCRGGDPHGDRPRCSGRGVIGDAVYPVCRSDRIQPALSENASTRGGGGGGGAGRPTA